MSSRRFVVLAARGKVGRLVARGLKEAGHEVTAATSDATAKADLAELGYNAVVFDPRQPDEALEHFRGADGVYLASADARDQAAVEIGLIDAMRRAGAPYVVKLSAQSAGLTPPVSFGAHHIRAERAVQKSGMAHAILRPTFFMQSLLLFADDVAGSGKLIAPIGKGGVAMVDARDVADCAVSALTGARAGEAIYTLTGPSTHSFGDVAARLSRLLDRKIGHISPPGLIVRFILPLKTGMPRWQSNLVVDLMTALRKGAQSEVASDVETLTGRPARALDAFLGEEVAAFEPKRKGM